MNTRHGVIETALGRITIVTDGEAVTGLYFAEHARKPSQEAFGAEIDVAHDDLLARTASQIDEYLAGRRRTFDIPLTAAGDDFHRAVWNAIARVPFGETTTYGAIAKELGNAGLAIRVGQAVGANPLSIVVPCHRVLGANGKLTGYAGGLDRKRVLLDLEEPLEVSSGRLF